MKKTLVSVIIAFFIVCGGIKPAEALIIDPGQIAAKISDFVEKISDSVSKITQQINQVKMMATQGYDLNALKSMAKKYYKIDQKFLTKRMLLLVKGTKAKQKEVLQKDVDLYKEVSVAQASEKLQDVEDDIKFLELEETETQDALSQKSSECPPLKSEYEGMEEGSAKERKWNEYTKCEAEKQLLESNVKEIKAVKAKLEEQKTLLEAELKEKESGDATYQDKKKRVEALEAQADNDDAKEVITASDKIGEQDEWDTFGPDQIAAKFTPSEKDYEEFMNRYFYDPDNLTSTDKQYEFQSNMDRILRERRYLFINTAVHLMQVATTVRREIPVRTVTINKMANDTSTETNEISAMSAYSATRVENAKALLLYAQLLSAKLQYLAARDLLQSDLKKEYADRDNFDEFDLGRYILDSDYLQELLESANTTINDEDVENYK